MNCRRILKRHIDYLSSVKPADMFWLGLGEERGSVTHVHTHTHTCSFTFLGILWSLLLCTLIGPCGCHAVARPHPCCVVIGVCGAAAWRRWFDWQVWPPALPWLPTWCGGVMGVKRWEEVAQASKGRALDMSRGKTQDGRGHLRIKDGLCWNVLGRLKKI